MNTLDEFNVIVDDRLTDYLVDLQGESAEPARSMEREAEDREFPIVGPLVGRFLELMAGLIRPDSIVELGSGFGYSAYWFRQGCDATIHLTDHDEDNLRAAENYLSETSGPDHFIYHHGDALESAREIEEAVDLVFVDIDKEEYPDALRWAEQTLEPGGWLIADNVLREGRVVDPDEDDTAARAVREFNERLYSDTWTTSILPLRDGVSVSRLSGNG